MRPLSKLRFDALAGYARKPRSRLMGEELGWFEHGGERVLATLIRDATDGDYGGIILARDRKGCFRCVDVSPFNESRRRAEAEMRRRMEAVAHQDDSEYHQGDEKGGPLNFFTPVVPRDRRRPSFVRLAEAEVFSPARGIIEPMMRWYEDADGNFVEQFQTNGFDARIWELYLFAAFSEMGYDVDRTTAVPDFTCKSPDVEFCVEASTVGPSREGPLATPPPLDDSEGALAFLLEFMPMKYGSVLFSKLEKRYWERPNVKGKPLIFAVADFHDELSMIRSNSSLSIYLYGYQHDWHKDTQGQLHIVPKRIEKHCWGGKEIPSGFFNRADAAHISAVVANSSGTITKFLRMGMLAGFGSRRVLARRVGTALDHNHNAAEPIAFDLLVNSPNYQETWVEGMNVFHNPNALHPLHEALLPGAAHHWLRPDGQVQHRAPSWHPFIPSPGGGDSRLPKSAAS